MKTEKRLANVGERILITDVVSYEDRFTNGDIFEVTSTLLDGGVYVEGTKNILILTEEYEVITERS